MRLRWLSLQGSDASSIISTPFGSGTMESRAGNWQEFEIWLQELQTMHAKCGLIFRGQANSEWLLESALERNGKQCTRFSEYYELIARIAPAVGTFTETRIPMLDQAVLMKEVCDPELFARAYYAADIHPPGVLFEFMAYLRHHGFPSPLLDWSRFAICCGFFCVSRSCGTERSE